MFLYRPLSTLKELNSTNLSNSSNVPGTFLGVTRLEINKDPGLRGDKTCKQLDYNVIKATTEVKYKV